MITRYPKPYIAFGVLIVIMLAALSFTHIPFFSMIDRLAYDIQTRLATSYVQAKSSRFALVTTPCAANGGFVTPPLSNSQLAELVAILKQRGIRDIVITFPVRNEWPEMSQMINKMEKYLMSIVPTQKKEAGRSHLSQYLEDLQRDLDPDRSLLDTVKQAGNVIFSLSVVTSSQQIAGSSDWTPRDLLALGPGGLGIFDSIHLKVKKPPFVDVYDASAGAGHGLLFYGNELPQRMHPPFLRHGNGLVPSLPVVLAMRYLGSTPSQVEVTSEQMKIGNRVIPLVAGKVILSPGRIFRTLPSYSATEILTAKKAPLELKGKTAILGPKAPLIPTNPISVGNMNNMISVPEVIAGITENIINGPYLERPGITKYLEVALILTVCILGGFLFPRAKYLSSLLLLILLILLSIFTGWAFISLTGIWFRVSHSVVGCLAMFVLYSTVQISRLDRVAKEAIEANRLLGLNFQKQGVMELAFERFKMCPLNNITRDLIYELAQECESRGLNSLAWQAYSYTLKKGDFRDAAQRLIHLQSLQKFPGFDSQGARKREGPLSESFIKQRKVIGRYQVIEPLGKGTMGYVYKAVDPKINRPVALKIIRFSDEFEEDLISEIRERFFREAEIAGRLNHPSIVTIYDVGEDRDLTYMAMEYLEGKDLEVYCQKDTLLPLMKVLEVIYQVAGALDYAHGMGVIHRDIKPANIMLLSNGTVRVTDFGIAKAVSSSRTKTGVILGTPNYMSPEQIMGHKMDARSDIFSLGVLFFQLLTGQLPFHGDNLSSLLYQITQAKHPSIRELRPRVPKACEQIIDKALAKSPADRFKSARDMKRYIQLLMMRLKEIKNRNKSN